MTRVFILSALALLAVGGLLLPVSTAQADLTFTLRDYLHHRWQNELVTYRVDKDKVPQPARLLGPEGQPVPVQIRDLGKQAEVAFIVRDLPAEGEVVYTLIKGEPVGRSLVAPQGGVPEAIILDAGKVAVAVPAASERNFPAGTTLAEAPPPLLQVRGPAEQAWIGRGSLLGTVPVKSMRATLVASGPVYAEARTDYVLEGGRYSMTVRVIAGQPVARVTEEFDMPAAAVENAYFRFSVREGLEPQRLAVQGRLWRKRADSQSVWPTSLGGFAGQDFRLERDTDRREVQVIGYVPWWPETVRLITLHGGPSGQALSFFPSRVGDWRNPMGTYLETRGNGDVYLSFPLYVKQTWNNDGVEWGSPYYTGRLEAGWPRTALRRHWTFLVCSEDEAFPGANQSEVARAVLQHSDLPLDKIKDWVFDWPWEQVKYPRLYLDPEKLAEVRQRALALPGGIPGLGQYHTRPLTYILTGDPKVGDELLHAEISANAPPEQWPSWYATAGALPGLRFFVSRLFDNWGYIGFFSPNNAAPMTELLRYDAAMSVAEATAEEKEEMSRLIAFVAQMVFDPDWHAVGSGWHLGNPNMPPRQEHYLGIASRLMPTHPLAAAWAERGAAEQRRLLEDMVRPSGAWRECPHYQFEAAMYPMMQSAVPLRLSGRYDVFTDPRLKKTMTYLVNMLTPPSPRFKDGEKKLRVLPAFGNGSWEFMPLTGWVAAMTAEQDPEFSRLMMWAWHEQGRPSWFQMSPLVLQPDLPAEQPELKSALFEGFGAVLRSGFPSEDETWMAFRHGNCIEHYNYGDQGSFMLYAKGAPLVLHFGSQYTPYFQGAWHFNRACFNHRPVRADEPAAEMLRGFGLDPANYSWGTEGWQDLDASSYVMNTKGFASFASADYAHGEQIQTEQGAVGKDPDQPLPPNTPIPTMAIPETHWNRRVLLLKDPDPLAPNYYLIRDDFTTEGEAFPGEWNIWTLAENVQFQDNRALVTSKYGVLLEVFMAEPAQPQWNTRQATNQFVAGPSAPYVVEKPWIEVLTNLRAHAAPGQGFLAVLYPRKVGEPAPTFEALAGGKGVKVVTPKGTDWAFLSEEPVRWTGEGLSFSGTAGAIRRLGDKYTVVFLEPGEATVNGRTVKAEQAQEVGL